MKRAALARACAAALATIVTAGAWPQPAPAGAPADRAAATATSDTPFGLSLVWRANGRKIERGVTGTALNAFSPNGRYVAVYEGLRVRVFDASTGKVTRDVALDPSSVPASSLAVSSNGKIALGRMGNAEVLEPGKQPVRHWCVGACGTLAAVAFSPDERFLAYQGTRGMPEWRTGLGGLISVVDLKTGIPTHLEAVASIAQVTFSPDGRALYAMNVSKLDDREAFGVRVWNTSNWGVAQTVLGSNRAMRRVAALGGGKYEGVAMTDGNMEARDLGDNRVLWSVPLVPPELTGTDDAAAPTNLDLVEIAPNGTFVLSYEASTAYDATGVAKGTLVLRRAADGVVEALYDVGRISDLAIAPDGKTFLYSTASGQTYTAVARVPF
jgi:WD40 repeat protein